MEPKSPEELAALAAKRTCWSRESLQDVYKYGFLEGYDQGFKTQVRVDKAQINLEAIHSIIALLHETTTGIHRTPCDAATTLKQQWERQRFQDITTAKIAIHELKELFGIKYEDNSGTNS